jgi:hypothetical protein
VVHISLKPNETERRREQFSKYKWLQMKEEIAQKEIISYNKITQLIKTRRTFLQSRKQVRKSSEKKGARSR